jgi:hypothetical protein
MGREEIVGMYEWYWKKTVEFKKRLKYRKESVIRGVTVLQKHHTFLHIAFISVLCVSLAFSQGPDTSWTRLYGGPRDEYGYSVRQTTDGGYIIAGTDEIRVYLIKTDSDGDTMWTNNYGGTYNNWGYSVQQTNDGGYIISGATMKNESGTDSGDIYLIKTDSLGDTSWTRMYGGDYTDHGYSVQQTEDGGYIIAGYTASYNVLNEFDVYLVKTDEKGDTVWTKTYGELSDDYGYSVQQIEDGGYIITGVTTRDDSTLDVYLIRTDDSGLVKWKRRYGGTSADCGYSVLQTVDGGYIIAGYTTQNILALQNDVFLIKTDSDGDTTWTHTYGGSYDDGGYSVYQTTDGGYIITGSTADIENETHSDVYVIKTDPLGAVMWTKRFGGLDDDGGYSIQQTTDGGYIITGYSGSFTAGNKQIYLIKTKPIITIESPNGGEMVQGGSIYTIEWSPENPPRGSFVYRLLFSSDGGNTYPDTIAYDIDAADESWEWTVPLMNATRCVIKIELLNAAGDVISEDTSNEIFKIDMTAPIIDSTTIVADTSYSGPFEIYTKITDNFFVDSVLLYYRRDQDPDWIALVMNQTGLPLWYVDSIPFVSNPGDTVRYYIEARDGAGNSVSDPQEAPADYYWFIVNATGIAEYNMIPALFSFGLTSNPIRGQANFYVCIPTEAHMTLHIYDITGRLVATPVTGHWLAGSYELPWNVQVSSGIYFYVFTSPWKNEVGKLVLIR